MPSQPHTRDKTSIAVRKFCATNLVSASCATRAKSSSRSLPRSCTKMLILKKENHILPAFLSKTFEIFSHAEFADICGWNAAGDTIIVTYLEAFVSQVLPRFFKHRNFPSFVRQLNIYGFHKTVLDSRRLEFQHPFFKRNRPELLQYIRRKSSVSNTGPVEPVRAMPFSGEEAENDFVVTQSTTLKHRQGITGTLLHEIKVLSEKNEAMEKRLMELEADTNVSTESIQLVSCTTHTYSIL
ncbi:hypothetical protein ABG067_002278 [Albugo candida]